MTPKTQAALLLDPGLGKTKIMIDLMAILREAGFNLNVLVVAPKVALSTWREEFRKHAPETFAYELCEPEGKNIPEKADRLEAFFHEPVPWTRVALINHDFFSQNRTIPGTKTVKTRDYVLRKLKNVDTLIVDESHRVKNVRANRTKALTRLARSCDRVYLMTGTVAPKNPIDVFGQWQVMNPKRFGDWSSFANRYVRYGGFLNKEVIGFRHMDEFKELVAMDAFIAEKRECLDLPPVTETYVHVDLGYGEGRHYSNMSQNFFSDIQGQTVSAPNALSKLQKLRQITSGFIKDGGTIHDIGDSKLAVCRELVEDLQEQGERVVVFAHFVRDVARISDSLNNCEAITGSTSQGDRDRIFSWFKDTPGSVIVAQMRTMGISINDLVVSSQAIFYSMSERRDDWIQAKDRLDRNGQTSPVHIQYLVVPNTVDEALYTAHREKKRLEDIILDDPHKYLKGI